MFYALPPMINLLILMLPIVVFRVYDYWAYGHHVEYSNLRRQHGSYWVYRTRAPRNPSLPVYVLQFIWGGICLIPLT